jgi:uncharacterized protein (TIGR00255 family)
MALDSMTGFARAQGAMAGTGWHWEVRSVNGRGLDVRLRVPPGHEALELKAREAIARRFQRGSLQASLSVIRNESSGDVRLNEQVLCEVLKAAERIRALTGGAAPTVEGLLALRGVLEFGERQTTDEEAEAVCAGMLTTLNEALDGVAAARRAEGGRLTTVISDQLSEIERIVAAVTVSPARGVDAVRRRITEALARLGEQAQSFDPARLHQEAVLIATRADIEEEVKRLTAHIAAARDLLADGKGAGRKLDFLTQEFNREANTLCSKANEIELTRLGLALKAVIDQMREQVQNIE